jgi:hypothetical protein
MAKMVVVVRVVVVAINSTMRIKGVAYRSDGMGGHKLRYPRHSPPTGVDSDATRQHFADLMRAAGMAAVGEGG